MPAEEERAAPGSAGPSPQPAPATPSATPPPGVGSAHRRSGGAGGDRLQLPRPDASDRYLFNERTPCQRFPERYTPVQSMGSLERYHHATLDRYSRTSTPTDRYHTLSSEKHAPSDKFTLDPSCPADRYRSGSVPAVELFKPRERSVERRREFGFAPIPCPERFACAASGGAGTGCDRPEPPSPAPNGDRFVPPPPLSPASGGPEESPDGFAGSGAFPSPREAAAEAVQRFVPPPPLSPTERRYAQAQGGAVSPGGQTGGGRDKQRYQDKYPYSPNTSNDRYHQEQHRYKDRYQTYQDRYHVASSNPNYHQQQAEKYSNADRYSGERYLPPNAHMPVERYVPQPQEPYYGPYAATFDRYGKQYQSTSTSATDPYSRRDLTYQYRIPTSAFSAPSPFQRPRYGPTVPRPKCCQYQDSYQLARSSPGSSSSSSVNSQGKDLHKPEVMCLDAQCQSLQCYQEKSTQCGGQGCHAFAPSPSANAVRSSVPCRHSVCAVEYVGVAGGRRVCATPPPRGGANGSECQEIAPCCQPRRSVTALAVAAW